MRKVLPVLLIAILSSCAKPSDGPSAGAIRSATFPGSSSKVPVIELSKAPAVTAAAPQSGYSASEPGLSVLRGAYNQQRLRPGDVFDVTLLDTGEEGLFSSTHSSTLNLGRFTVDPQGSVTMPFVGKQRVTDSTPEGLQNRIVQGMKGSAVNPQAVVTVVDKPSSAVLVSGGVKTPGKVALTARRERVLDIISQSGGASVAPQAAKVTVVRGRERATTTLDRVMSDEKQNIVLLPGDQVIVDGEPASYTALGAFKSTGEFQFETGKLTLAQAVGRAGGLLDDRADARNVYVFRNQLIQVPASTVTASGAKGPVAMTTSSKPVIYHVNMKDASSIMLMQLFQMQKGDVLYASNSGMVDAAKLLTVYQKVPSTSAAPLPGSSN
ncbi:polysaccharide export protein [Agrobacterium vitis]|uniref:Polysaccharide export protein n=2 Tax=Rhizobium/Agrobacterium group TaxID=227290 RepID=B9K2F2_ALLAM|nr:MULTISPECIES: polysaccharide biosynthesis/export family protein [Rhizobium/Agrobacterium group]ACM39050.1 polysaccharide export protein [Allorhizobium ampelinum S4]MCF1445199.1 polysaccharide export protein [Allorhizobium ampelinum]MUO30922.1 polysaccharide export protein [Agrobacterium vitis]MUO40687.1 polysaccharide export protein [Agrobacterium vitis]MUO79103.1 polysaccharide export protein [Agrobacterium vitis]